MTFRHLLISASLMTAMVTSASAHDNLRENIAADYEANLESLFTHFHENPELSFREFKTSERLAEEIEALGYDVTTGIGQTGVVAVLKTARANGDDPGGYGRPSCQRKQWVVLYV